MNGLGARVNEARLDVSMLREAASHLSPAAFKEGRWFKTMIHDHVKKHVATVSAATWDELYPGFSEQDRAEKHIARVALKASAAGMLASVGASTGELLSLVTEGLAAPIGLPAAMFAMGLEAAYTSLLQIDLACDLASIHGVPFDPEDLGEIATLFAIALEIEAKKKEGPEGGEAEKEGLEEKLVHLEDGEIATRIGRKMLEESLIKNVVPVVGVAISARWSYVATRKLGKKVNKYVRYRRAVQRAFQKLDLHAIEDKVLVLHGAWLLCTCDGEAGHEEVLALAALAQALSPDVALELNSLPSVDDEDTFLDAITKLAPSAHKAVLDALYLVAATDRALTIPEKRMLHRVGKALGEPIDFERIEQLCKHLDEGEELPALHASS